MRRTNLDPLALIILIPLCDRFLYPVSTPRTGSGRTTDNKVGFKALERCRVRFGPIRKIAAGFFAATLGSYFSRATQGVVLTPTVVSHDLGRLDTACHVSTVVSSPVRVWTNRSLS